MLDYYTVDTLLEELTKLQKAGLGNKNIIVSSDDEGNNYRCLLYQEILTSKKDIQEYVDPEEHSVYVSLDNCILL